MKIQELIIFLIKLVPIHKEELFYRMKYKVLLKKNIRKLIFIKIFYYFKEIKDLNTIIEKKDAEIQNFKFTIVNRNNNILF